MEYYYENTFLYFYKFGSLSFDKSINKPHYNIIKPIMYTSDLKISMFYSSFKIYGEYSLPYEINNGSDAVALGSNTLTNELFINILSVPSTPYAISYC